MGFNYPTLLWGLPILALPVLIHLINVLRLRRVQWAAMDFLLKSYKKHRRWVWLKQLLLLLLRIAAFAVLVLMVAQWDPSQQWMARMQRRTTHHYVVVDDSYSMSEQVGGSTAFDAAMQAIQRLAADAAQETSQQRFTLIRLSRAARADDDASSSQMCDINAMMMDQQFDVLLEDKRRAFNATQLSIDPAPALKLVGQLMENGLVENRRLYLFSDFRSKEWSQPAEVRESLQAIEELDSEIHMVRCVKEPQGNLAVVNMEPTSDTRAAGVPLFVNVTVRNHGKVDATKVQLRVRTLFYTPDLDRQSPEDAKAESEDAPVELIDVVPAGEEVVRRVQVYFPQSGKHVVEAFLPDDAVNTDNRRWIVVEFPEYEPTLVIDGDLEQRNGYYLQSIFQPGQRAKTGVGADVQSADFLRDASEEELRRFTSIYLCDVERLDEGAVKQLEKFVAEGGGLAVFVGPRVNFLHYNEKLYREGEGFLPAPIGRDVAVKPPSNLETPYVNIENVLHPVFQQLFAGSNPLIGLIRVDRTLAPPSDWKAEGDKAPKVLATLHSGEPLVLEKSFGRGRVVMFLTTYAPQWNDMVLGPNVIVALKLQSYLAEQTRAARLGDSSQEVGDPLVVRAPASQFRRDWRFSAPSALGDDRLMVSAAAEKNTETNTWQVVFGGEDPALGRGVTDISGVYEAWLATNEGSQEVRRMAMNVDPEEGDLQLQSSQSILTELEPVKALLHEVGDNQIGGSGGGDSRFDWLFALLIGVCLIAEQALAYSASYHPPGGVA